MDLKKLESKCKERYGKIRGRKLFKAMAKIAEKDLCVGMGYNDLDISISKSCDYIGKIFKFTGDYKALVISNKNIIGLDKLNYAGLVKFLPNRGFIDGGHENCYFDK